MQGYLIIFSVAIAYCYEGTTIRIEAHEKRRDVEIIFTNEGKKIPGSKLQTIFERFYRLDNSRSTETGGAGLDLRLQKRLWSCIMAELLPKSDESYTRFIVITAIQG